MAWFHSAPTDKTKKAGGNLADKEKPLTRAQRIEQNGGIPLMPDLEEAAYIAMYWQDVGFAVSGAMSAAPLTSLELKAWADGGGVELNSWEFSTLKEMSRAYVSQLHESESLECPPPYGAAWNEFDRGIVGTKVTNAFRALIQAKRK